MNRYFLYLSYNGANYCGWQIQPNAATVQEVIEKALATLLRAETSIVGAGRTDSGVHARTMIAHFDCAEPIDCERIVGKLNSILPRDIAIQKVLPVQPDAHARFDATARRYRYYITTRKDPFTYPFKYRMPNPLDVDKMNACANILFEYIDFTSFSKLHTAVKTNNCRIMEALWTKEGDSDYVFTIKADRFLRNMVRAIVGTLIEVGRGKLDEQGFRRIIEAKNRNVAGTSVPGNALFLEDVEYPSTLFL